MACNSPYTIIKNGIEYKVPCRICMSCRITRRNNFALRARLEAYEYAKQGRNSCFVGLSYAPDFLPLDSRGKPNLSKRDVQLFLKRLRADYKYRYNKSADFKYMIVGELGDTTHRSHYHCIFLGIPSKSMPFRKYWKKGFVTDVPLTTGRIRYALSYMDKQLLPKQSDELMKKYGFQSPFMIMSKGIGSNYYLNHYDEIYENNGVKNNGHITPLNSYYRKKFGLAEFDSSTVDFFKSSRARREGKSITMLEKEDFRARELSLLARSRLQGYPAKGVNLVYENPAQSQITSNLAGCALNS